ncbi:MAG: cell division protein FtsZ [Bacilli bacterium]|jgi:cell division protein FtsZ|nr:cell division protein FtsZ [Bacilli bacterium]
MQGSDLDNFEPIARIVVIGVGGAGNNAVNRMIDEDLGAVEFFVANTDRQTLATSKARNRIVLGPSITGGLGAGGEPSVGREAANASVEDIRKVVKGANMVFIAAGMGGGTGTGASPVVAQVAREEGALTVAIVTRPFTFEGKRRIANSVEGLNELKDAVDAIIIVSNDKLLMVSGTQPISEAFAESDRVLAQSVKTVTDLILMPAVINLDFADVKNTLKDSGISLIGFGLGQGPNRAQEAAQNAINSPLLEASINGARRAICSVTCGPNVSLYEAQEAVDLVIEAAGNNIDVKFGVAINNQLTDQILVSVIASDFTEEFDFTSVPNYSQQIRLQRPESEKLNNANEIKPNKEEKEEEAEGGDATSEDSILPSFLKNKHID